MIGEGYGYMEELAATFRHAQGAIINATLESETQKGKIEGSPASIKIVFE